MSGTVARGHVASPARLLGQTLTARFQELASADIEVACGGTIHRVAFDGARFYADEHDEAAEAVLQAVGGATPVCLRLVEAVGAAGSQQLWAALDPRPATGVLFDEVLRTLPETHLRVLLARALQAEFLDASMTVRDAVGQLGLALVGVEAPPIDLLRPRFQLTRELPHWDPGPGPWSDRELVLLSRCMRMGAGEARPHLQLLPADAVARRAVAKYVVALLDADRTISWRELRAALSPTFRNVRALSSLLVSEGLLDESEGGYRVRTPGRARPPKRRS